MAAAGTSPALNLREKLAELAGLKQRVSPDLVRCDFGNLVTNGTFDTDLSGWSLNNAGSGTVVQNAGGADIYRLSPSNLGRLYQGVTTAAGRVYVRKFDVSGGTVRAQLSNTSIDGTELSDASFTAGSHEVSVTSATTTLYIIFRGAVDASTVTVDNVSLYEADPSDDAPWLRLPFGYKVGQRGMIVRDGVVLHPSDYTEITDSGQTWIKPITAPGVSTEFSIWAGA